jgi:hypothetical protein
MALASYRIPRTNKQSRLPRIFAVVLGLVAIGAVLGSVLGVAAFAAIAVFRGGFGWLRTTSQFWDMPAVFGAAVGAVLAPLAAWTLMRHVPIWRAIAETSAGTIVGVIVGSFFSPLWHLGVLWPAMLGIGGFLFAAIRLRVAARTRRAEIPSRAG